MGNLWWYTHVLHVPFALEDVEATATSHHTYHPKLFVLEGFRQVGEALALWASRHALASVP